MKIFLLLIAILFILTNYLLLTDARFIDMISFRNNFIFYFQTNNQEPDIVTEEDLPKNADNTMEITEVRM